MSSFSSGRLAVYKIKPYKNTPDNKLKKKTILSLKTLSLIVLNLQTDPLFCSLLLHISLSAMEEVLGS